MAGTWENSGIEIKGTCSRGFYGASPTDPRPSTKLIPWYTLCNMGRDEPVEKIVTDRFGQLSMVPTTNYEEFVSKEKAAREAMSKEGRQLNSFRAEVSRSPYFSESDLEN